MRIILAVDLSDDCEQLVARVAESQYPADAKFKVLTVLPQSEISACKDNHDFAILQTKQKETRKRAEYILAKVRLALIENLGIQDIHAELRVGSVSTEIIAAATEWMANKIVLGLHQGSPNRLSPHHLPNMICNQAQCAVELVPLAANDNRSTTSAPSVEQEISLTPHQKQIIARFKS